jgi:hypothetical protein
MPRSDLDLSVASVPWRNCTYLFYFVLQYFMQCSVTNQDHYRICCQRSFEELFPGRSALISFLNADFGLFSFSLSLSLSLFCDSSMALLWRSTLSHCLNVSIPSHFNILPFLLLLLFVCWLWSTTSFVCFCRVFPRLCSLVILNQSY